MITCEFHLLGTPVVPFLPFLFWAPPPLNLNRRKTGTLIMNGLLGNLAFGRRSQQDSHIASSAVKQSDPQLCGSA